MMSGKDFLKSDVLSCRRKMYSNWEDVTSSGRAFQVFGPATGKARLPTDCSTGTSGPRYGILCMQSDLSECRVLHLARHMIGHFGDESFQAVTRNGTGNSKHSSDDVYWRRRECMQSVNYWKTGTGGSKHLC